MNTAESGKLITDYIEKEREEINTLKRKRNEELLDTLELYSIEKEYAPEDYVQPTGYYAIRTYPDSEMIDGTLRYYRKIKVYPEISDETYNELMDTLQEKDALTAKPPVLEKKEEKKPLEFSITPHPIQDTSNAALFMKIIAYILWIGGLILAIVSSRVEVSYSSYYTETVFQWTTFFTMILTYGLLGCFAMCMSEIFENISIIKNLLLGSDVKEKR